MRSISVERAVDAERPAVWKVLADFPGIAQWNSGVSKSFATSDAVEGVGATRHCDLAPMGELEETVVEWQPEERMVISIDEASKIPVKSGLVTFTLVESEPGTTVTIDYEYNPKGGPLALVMGPFIDRALRKGFGGFIEDLGAEALRGADA